MPFLKPVKLVNIQDLVTQGVEQAVGKEALKLCG